MEHAVLSCLQERLVVGHFLRDCTFVERQKLRTEYLVDEVLQATGTLQLSGVLLLDRLQQFDFLGVVGTDKQVDDKVVEGRLLRLFGGSEICSLLLTRGGHDIINLLEALGNIESHLFVDEVPDHELEEVDLQLLQALLAHVTLANFPRKNLAADKVLPHKNQLHLIEDELKLLLDGQRPIRLNLDLLDDVGRLIGLVVFLHVLAQGHRSIRVFKLEEHLALARLLKNFKHLVLLITRRQLLKERCLAHENHVGRRLLRLTAALAQSQEKFSQLDVVLIIEGNLEDAAADLRKLDVVGRLS